MHSLLPWSPGCMQGILLADARSANHTCQCLPKRAPPCLCRHADAWRHALQTPAIGFCLQGQLGDVVNM